MEKMSPLISESDLFSMSKKKYLTKEDIEKMASFSKPSLISKIKDLNYSEDSEVEKLEVENITFLLNAFIIGLGKNQTTLKKMAQDPEYSAALRDISSIVNDESSNPIEKAKQYFVYLAIYILSNGDIRNMRPKFQGQIPKKMFSSRQTNAEDWFNDTVKFYIASTSLVIEKAGSDFAYFYILSAIAWYLNNSQPYRFNSSSSGLSKKIFDILNEIDFGEVFTHVEKNL